MARRVANLVVALAAAAAAKCEVLRSLEFQQHTAPKGVSELLGPVVSLVSEKAEVGDIKIRWDGELGLHRVGTHSAATARASLTPPRPAPKVVSYPSLAPEQVEKAAYRSPFDSPTI